MLKGIVIYYLCLFSFWAFTKSITDNFKNSYATGYMLAFSMLLLTDGSLFHSFGIIIYLVYPVMILISISKDRYVDYRFHYKKIYHLLPVKITFWQSLFYVIFKRIFGENRRVSDISRRAKAVLVYSFLGLDRHFVN